MSAVPLPLQAKWKASEAAFDSLAAGMLVTILLDLWRITLGGIVDGSSSSSGAGSGAAGAGLPWM